MNGLLVTCYDGHFTTALVRVYNKQQYQVGSNPLSKRNLQCCTPHASDVLSVNGVDCERILTADVAFYGGGGGETHGIPLADCRNSMSTHNLHR